MTRAGLVVAMTLAAASCEAALPTVAASDPHSPLRLEQVIVLPSVKGRIDHLAFDPERGHLFVAEHDNGTVDEIDISGGRVVGRIAGLTDPQGVAWLAATGELVVASGDGSVRFYSRDRNEVARLDPGGDADNVRMDQRNGHVVVGYDGGLATIDPRTHQLIGRMKLPGHPEGFRLNGSRVLINLPDSGAILAGDIDSGAIEASWPTGIHRMNFPLAVASSGRWFAVAYRLPAAVAQLDAATGRLLSIRPGCGDADDLFLDEDHIYVVCGAGHVDVMPTGTGQPVRVTTARGARTGLFIPDLDKLFIAAPARDRPAAIWVLNARRQQR
jgi:DNA-binding beta-propeller fold protein YncE